MVVVVVVIVVVVVVLMVLSSRSTNRRSKYNTNRTEVLSSTKFKCLYKSIEPVT